MAFSGRASTDTDDRDLSVYLWDVATSDVTRVGPWFTTTSGGTRIWSQTLPSVAASADHVLVTWRSVTYLTEADVASDSTDSDSKSVWTWQAAFMSGHEVDTSSAETAVRAGTEAGDSEPCSDPSALALADGSFVICYQRRDGYASYILRKATSAADPTAWGAGVTVTQDVSVDTVVRDVGWFGAMAESDDGVAVVFEGRDVPSTSGGLVTALHVWGPSGAPDGTEPTAAVTDADPTETVFPTVAGLFGSFVVAWAEAGSSGSRLMTRIGVP